MSPLCLLYVHDAASGGIGFLWFGSEQDRGIEILSVQVSAAVLYPARVMGGCSIRCDAVEGEGSNMVLHCTCLSAEEAGKPKGVIQWVSATSGVKCEVRVYNPLFTVEEVNDDLWESQLNPLSEVVYPNSYVDPSIFALNPTHEFHVQVGTVIQGDGGLIFVVIV